MNERLAVYNLTVLMCQYYTIRVKNWKVHIQVVSRGQHFWCASILEGVVKCTPVEMLWTCWFHLTHVQDSEKQFIAGCNEILIDPRSVKGRFEQIDNATVAHSEWIYCSKITVAPAQCMNILIHQCTIFLRPLNCAFTSLRQQLAGQLLLYQWAAAIVRWVRRVQ